MPILAPAPPRFSITTGRPKASLSGGARMRARISVAPPGGKLTESVMARSGKAACAGRSGIRAAAAPAKRPARRLNSGVMTKTFPSFSGMAPLMGKACDWRRSAVKQGGAGGICAIHAKARAKMPQARLRCGKPYGNAPSASGDRPTYRFRARNRTGKTRGCHRPDH